MTGLETVEIFSRGGAVATLLLCAALFAARAQAGRKDASVAALCLGLCAYLLVSSPGLGIENGAAHRLLVVLAGIVPVLLYWAGIELFQDEPPRGRWQLVVCGLVGVSAWFSFASAWLGALRGAGVILLLSHLLFIVAAGEAEDLVEGRRRFRRVFLGLVVLVALAITSLEITGGDSALPPLVYLLHAALFWGLGLVFVLWAARIDPAIWLSPRPKVPGRAGLTHVDQALIGRIEAAMAEGLWRQEGLTIGQMARSLGTQEHRLRSAINQALGYRNFARFINRYRIAEARALLRDPMLAERTVLSIAYEVGFASLGPFNRAFREETGQTPTEYRRAAPS